MNGQNSMPYSPENQSTLVAGKKRIRSTSVCVWLSPDEQTKIRERMADVGIRNLSAYMRNCRQGEYLWRSLPRRNQDPAKGLCGFMGAALRTAGETFGGGGAVSA